MSQTLSVEPYAGEQVGAWDSFVEGARNGTFLHRRGYMDYHSDRFQDCSLMVRDDAGRLVALFPADLTGTLVRSHGGLTYGALVIDDAMTMCRMLEVMEVVTRHLRHAGAERLLYKTVPSIYHRQPADEDLYALYRAGARLVRRDVLTVLERSNRGQVQERRARSIRKAQRQGVVVRESTDYRQFWQILQENLAARHGVPPVHSVEEMEMLASRFPAGIRLHAAYRDDRMLAGALLYVSANVSHVQYNAASPDGRRCGALDLVLETLIASDSYGTRYFDFGASTEDHGRILNAGLVGYKEGFGARTIVHDAYELDLMDLSSLATCD